MRLSISRPYGLDMRRYLDKLEEAGFQPEASKQDMDGVIDIATIELESLEDLLRLQKLVDHPLVLGDEWFHSSDIVIEDSYRY